MKCLVTADLHYALRQWDWVTQMAGQYDLIVLAGDLLDIASIVDLDAQIIVVRKYLGKIQGKTRLLVSSGNHDGDERNAANESVATWLRQASDLGILVDGDHFAQDGWLFTICPWWDGPATRGEVVQLLARDASRPKRKWIWVYHAPPDRSRVSWTGKDYFGDADLPAWIAQYQPDIVLSGHVHQSPFRPPGSWVDHVGGAWVFNAGRQLGPEPAHLILDLDALTARWVSQAGEELVNLADPLTANAPQTLA